MWLCMWHPCMPEALEAALSLPVSALSYGFKSRHLADPTGDYVVRKLIAGAHRLDEGLADDRTPITCVILCQLLRVVHVCVQLEYE